MNEREMLLREHVYVPAVAIVRATLRHSWNKIPVATVKAPEWVCGEARRIGYTGRSDSDLALYRLKIKANNGHPTMTLPALYVVKDGVFQDYEQWRQVD